MSGTHGTPDYPLAHLAKKQYLCPRIGKRAFVRPEP